MLSLQHISKTFGIKDILGDVSFSVNPGEVIALIGENGSGKTTLLRIILGEVTPDTGDVLLNNEIVSYLPQNPSLNTTIENSFNDNIPSWAVDQALKIVGLDQKAKTTEVSSLSGGQKTRLVLATILAQDPYPTVLLLDEPTNNLDSEGIVWLEKFIESFNGGIIITSHDRTFINQIATKVIEVDQGKIHQYGGNYDFYKTQKEIERESEFQHYEEVTSERKRLAKIRQEKMSQMKHTTEESFDKTKHESRLKFHTGRNASEKNLGKQLNALESRIGQLETAEKPKILKNYQISMAGTIKYQ